MRTFVSSVTEVRYGEPTLGRDARAATLYSVGSMQDPDHEATIRFCGEAPRRRAHSGHGFKAMAVFGSPRIMISGCCQGAKDAETGENGSSRVRKLRRQAPILLPPDWIA